MRTLLNLLTATVSLGVQPALAEPPQDSPDNPAIVVDGRSAREMDHYLAKMLPSRDQRQIARWNSELCSSVIGLEATHAAFIKERVDALSKSMSIRLGKAGSCRPNLTIAFTNDADELALQYVRKNAQSLGTGDDGLQGGGGGISGAYKKHLLSPRPVRWLNLERSERADGTGGIIVVSRPPYFVGSPNYFLGRTRMQTRESIFMSFVIVDAKRIDGITWAQLADYISMAALARPDMDAQYGTSMTIMSLFERRDTGAALPNGLSEQDHAILTALYRTESDQSASRQRSAIRRAMDGAARAPVSPGP